MQQSELASDSGAAETELIDSIGDLLGEGKDFLDSLLLCDSPEAPSSESGIFSESLFSGLESPNDDLSSLLG